MKSKKCRCLCTDCLENKVLFGKGCCSGCSECEGENEGENIYEVKIKCPFGLYHNAKLSTHEDTVFNIYQINCSWCKSNFISLCKPKHCLECGQSLKWQVKS